MSDPLMFDASTPPAAAPAGYGAVAGYIGGSTPHVWTPAEWARFGPLKKLPVWVASAAAGPSTGAVIEAFAALQQLYRLGVPKSTPVALDMETRADPGYVTSFGRVMSWAGYLTWVYGSASTVFANPPLSGYWVADYAGRGPFMFSHPLIRATQYADGQAFDSSTVKPWEYDFRLKAW